jgi:hypothetical protein
MKSSVPFRALASSVALATALLVWPSTAPASTTGSLAGTVVDAATRAPIAGALITASSPSQVAHATTDAAGRFTFISLAPDTYTISAEHSGFDTLSTAGISVIADQHQSIPIALQKSIKEIARVAARSSLSPVRSGTGTDVYSVNSALSNAAAPLGGGGGLNNAYSAIAAMPGAYVPPNQVGVNQSVYIRGGFYDQIGFEYDGVPVNRSFDNFPGNSLSTLGQQELQIYTGGGEADSNATGLAGFINQVIKTGTTPGYGIVGGAIGSPTFYHDLRVEAGGATPDRSFSYYVGISGTDQDFRYFDHFNGASLTDTIPYGFWPAHITTFLPFYPAVYPTCNNDSTYNNPAVNDGLVTSDPGCFGSYPSSYGQASTVNGREVVGNFHFAIPHKHDGGRDDVQALYMSSANFTRYYTSENDAAGLGFGLVNDGNLLSPPDFFGGNTNQWPDYYTYPASTSWLQSASAAPIAYMYPGSPTARCANVTGVPNACPVNANGNQETIQVPSDFRDGTWNTASIVKLQYQKNFGSSAYLRLFGYTFYSNTNEASANGWGNNVSLGVLNYQYEVNSHTRGVELEFADQVSDKHLLSGMASYLTSNTLRYFNHNYDNTSDQQVSNLTNGKQCFATVSGPGIDPRSNYTAGGPAPCNDPATQGTFGGPFGNFAGQSPCTDGELPATAPACAAGASMRLTYLGNTADINAVAPKLTNASIADQWRPSDKWNINASVRFERDEYDLANTNSPGTNFWFAAAQKEFCVNPVTRQPIFVPQPPQSIFVFTPYVTFNCPVDTSTGTAVQTVHPNGTDGILLTNNYPSTYTQSYVEPRVSATYTVNPDTVLRASAGRYAQQPQNYEIQYNTSQANLASTLLGFIPFGFSSPLHEAQAQFSNNYDFSLEHHFRGTDVSMKVTPFYRWATNQLYETVNLPSLNISPSFNSGTQRVGGIELELTKGDFERDGFSGVFSYTYTNSTEKWDNFPNSTVGPVDQYNQDIEEYNALTAAGGGARCYVNDSGVTLPDGSTGPGTISPDPTCATVAFNNPPIRNPYFPMSKQPLLDPHGWYAPGLDFPYLSPNTFSLILNYKHGKVAVTPAMSLSEGTTYGTPADVQGIDPRTCTANQGSLGIPTGNPLNADYTSCSFAATEAGTSPGTLYIPNPQTGSFDTFGEFRQPWQFNLGLQMSYDFSPRLTGRVIVTNLINQCFGGSSEPWSRAYPANNVICGYTSNTFYNGGNYFNGTSPNDIAANGVRQNPYFANSFAPSFGDTSSGNYPLALNLYFSLQIKL